MIESAAGSPASAPQPAVTPQPKRVRVHHLREAKKRGERLTMLTAYDYPTARIFDEAGIDMLLIGDSIGNTMLGADSTLPVTVDELIPAVRAVSAACKRAFVVADLPFGSYESSPEQAFFTAVRMLKEGGAHAVKFEGGKRVAAQVRKLTDAGIPVVGHLGFTPQSENLLGGARHRDPPDPDDRYRRRGRVQRAGSRVARHGWDGRLGSKLLEAVRAGRHRAA